MLNLKYWKLSALLIWGCAFCNQLPEGVGKNAVFNENSGLYEKGELNGNGNREGIWAFWYDNGELQRNGKYVNGNKTGIWESYFINGLLGSYGKYNANLREGNWLFYFDRVSRTISDDDPFRIVVSSMPSDVIGVDWNFTHGPKMIDGNYIAGLWDGIWNFYHLCSVELKPKCVSQPQLEKTITYLDGEPTSNPVCYDFSGLEITCI